MLNCSDVIPWGPIPLDKGAKISSALRRRLPISDVASTEVVVGGEAHQIGPTDRLVLQIVGTTGALRFDELVSQVRAAVDTIAEDELRATVVCLAESGLLNISVNDEAPARDLDDELAKEPVHNPRRDSSLLSRGP
jgi:hypothetical protein